VERYGDLASPAAGHADPQLKNDDLDTGKVARLGEYGLADTTYAVLLHRLAAQKFAGLTLELQQSVLGFFQSTGTPNAIQSDPQEWQRVLAELEALRNAPVAATWLSRSRRVCDSW
jgi:hypothetical protein